MAVITNYATLQTEVANALARDDLTADIPMFIQFAENKQLRQLPHSSIIRLCKLQIRAWC